MTVPKPMNLRNFATRIAFCTMVCLIASHANAQWDALSAEYDQSDFKFFSPVDLDFDCNPIRKDCGYFFRYDKLSWAFRGVRTTVGDPNINVQSEIIYYTSAQGGSPLNLNEANAPSPYQINNSIQDAVESKFGLGNRYEFGKFEKGNGWTVGIIDGPVVTSQRWYGFESLQIPNSLPLDNLDNEENFGAGFTATLVGTASEVPLTGSVNLATSNNGFGSVHVNFDTPDGWLLGFRDYHINGPNNENSQTSGGPGLQVVGITVADGEVTDITLSQGADGIVDDLNGNGGTFFVFLDDEDNVIGTGLDFGDLHEFNVAFERFFVKNTTRTDGIELMKTFDLSNRHHFAKKQNNSAQIGVGVRYLRLKDQFYWDGRGGILGRTYATTTAVNSIVGPQIRGIWNSQHGRWNLGIDGRFVFGYNVQDQDQDGAIGEDLTPGAANSLLLGQPHSVRYGRNENFFSPIAELRAESSYQITSGIAVKLGYTGMFIDNITRASQTVRWYLPDLGLLGGGNQDIFINGVNLGFEVVH